MLRLALPFAFLSLLLTSGFLIREWRWDEQSFADRPPLYWAVLNWVNLVSWGLACGAALLGKGKLRKAVLLWCVSLPLLAYFVFMMGYNY